MKTRKIGILCSVVKKGFIGRKGLLKKNVWFENHILTKTEKPDRKL